MSKSITFFCAKNLLSINARESRELNGIQAIKGAVPRFCEGYSTLQNVRLRNMDLY